MERPQRRKFTKQWWGNLGTDIASPQKQWYQWRWPMVACRQHCWSYQRGKPRSTSRSRRCGWIGWTYEYEKPWGLPTATYGHISKKYASEIDRSKCCIKCGEEGTKRRSVRRHHVATSKRQALRRQITYLGPESVQYTRRHTNTCFKNSIEGNTNQPQPLRGSTKSAVPDGAWREGGCGYHSWPIQESRRSLLEDWRGKLSSHPGLW